MSLLENFPELVGFNALDLDGALGVYGEAGDFIMDKPITDVLQEHISSLLATLKNDPASNAIIGIVLPASKNKPWSSHTLRMRNDTVRKIYPLGGSKDAKLTAFQKKHQERSIFQGIELLLDYRDNSMPKTPVFCPVLVSGLDKAGGYILVVNLLENLSASRREKQEIEHIVNTIRSRIIKTQCRKETSGFGLMEDMDASAFSESHELSNVEAFANVDKRGQRELLALFNEGSAISYAGWLEKHSDSETFKRISGYLDKPYTYPEPVLLEKFNRFNEWDYKGLALIASRNPVFRAPASTFLLKRSTIDKWNLYLIEGQIELEAEDGATKLVEGGTDSARVPVSYLKPRLYSARSITDISFLWLYDPLIEALLKLTDNSNKLSIARKPESDIT